MVPAVLVQAMAGARPGWELTWPLPAPEPVTVNVWGAATANVAVTCRVAVIVTWHVPVPAQAPVQPVKVDPAVAVAVNVTTVPCEYVAPQVPLVVPPVLVQAIAGDSPACDAMEPAPAPAPVTVSPNVAAT
jgi:hypothetical protein